MRRTYTRIAAGMSATALAAVVAASGLAFATPLSGDEDPQTAQIGGDSQSGERAAPAWQFTGVTIDPPTSTGPCYALTEITGKIDGYDPDGDSWGYVEAEFAYEDSTDGDWTYGYEENADIGEDGDFYFSTYVTQNLQDIPADGSVSIELSAWYFANGDDDGTVLDTWTGKFEYHLTGGCATLTSDIAWNPNPAYLKAPATSVELTLSGKIALPEGQSATSRSATNLVGATYWVESYVESSSGDDNWSSVPVEDAKVETDGTFSVTADIPVGVVDGKPVDTTYEAWAELWMETADGEWIYLDEAQVPLVVKLGSALDESEGSGSDAGGGLADTGAEVVPLAIAGVVALTLGAAIVQGTRRRKL